MQNIPEGYQVQFRSWENDLDAQKTMIISGLSVHDARFYIAVAKHFMNDHGNDSMTREDMLKIFKSIYEDMCYLSDELFTEVNKILTDLEKDQDEDEEYDSAEEAAYTWLCENIFHYTESYQDYKWFARVIDDIKVYYYPGEIKDVTEEFVSK